MTVDFGKMLSPEKQESLKITLKQRADRRAGAKAMSNEEFADCLEYALVNCHELLRREYGDLVSYEDALVQIYIPEALRRLRGKEDIEPLNNYSNLRERIETHANNIRDEIKKRPHSK